MEHLPDGATCPRKREVPPPQADARPASLSVVDALRTTGAVREFTDQAVDDAVLARVLDSARFAPSGANAQAWRVVVVKNDANRRRLQDC
jgi:nitroreductase